MVHTLVGTMADGTGGAHQEEMVAIMVETYGEGWKSQVASWMLATGRLPSITVEELLRRIESSLPLRLCMCAVFPLEGSDATLLASVQTLATAQLVRTGSARGCSRSTSPVLPLPPACCV